MNYVQQLLISLPGQSDVPCKEGSHVIMLTGTRLARTTLLHTLKSLLGQDQQNLYRQQDKVR